MSKNISVFAANGNIYNQQVLDIIAIEYDDHQKVEYFQTKKRLLCDFSTSKIHSINHSLQMAEIYFTGIVLGQSSCFIRNSSHLGLGRIAKSKSCTRRYTTIERYQKY